MRYIEINTAVEPTDIPALIISNPLPRSGQPGGHAHARTQKSCLTTRPAYPGRFHLIRPPPQRRDARAVSVTRWRARSGWN